MGIGGGGLIPVDFACGDLGIGGVRLLHTAVEGGRGKDCYVGRGKKEMGGDFAGLVALMITISV